LLLMVDGMQFLHLLPLAGNKAVLLHPQQHLLRTGSERVTHDFHGLEGWVIQESVGRQCLSRLNFYSIEFMLVKTILFCWLCWAESWPQPCYRSWIALFEVHLLSSVCPATNSCIHLVLMSSVEPLLIWFSSCSCLLWWIISFLVWPCPVAW
jgi:hypothetical protein